MKRTLIDSLKETLRLALGGFVLWLMWTRLALLHNLPSLGYFHFLYGCISIDVIAGIWHRSAPTSEPEFGIYHICRFCGKFDTCKLGKKVTEKGLSVIDCPDWEESHESTLS